MKILFYHELTEQLGIEYLSSVLREAGHTCSLLFRESFGDNPYFKIPLLSSLLDTGTDELVRQAEAFSPDVVAFSTNICNHASARGVAKRIKDRIEVPIVLGGPLVTSLPDVFHRDDTFDYAIAGEGEE